MSHPQTEGHILKVAIIGGGPAGLFAAEYLCKIPGFEVHLYDHKPSVGRKFLIAGRGGLNLTHSEDMPAFMERYGPAAEFLSPFIEGFTPAELRQWAEDLGSETFIGSSGRVFPKEMKSTQLMRAWTKRLTDQGLHVHLSHSFTGSVSPNELSFTTADGATVSHAADVTLFATGGASYPHLGATGDWAQTFENQGIAVQKFTAMNCGYNSLWSAFLVDKFEGTPLKNIGIRFEDQTARGDVIITKYGLEGGAIYALSRELTAALDAGQDTEVHLDLRPDMTMEQLTERLSAPRKKQSFSNYLRKQVKLSSLDVALLHEGGASADNSPETLSGLIKNLPFKLESARPITRAISSSGGVPRDALDGNLMIKSRPGWFAAGEMIDWDAPTGGYLLQASFATGLGAAKGIENWLAGAR